MASKKMKKALALGLGVGLGAKFLAGKARAASIAANEAKEAGFANTSKKFDYITKKKTPETFLGKVKKATKKIIKENINLGPGINATSKKGGTLAGDYGEAFSDEFGMPKGAKAGKMIKAVTGVHVEVESRGNKLARPKKTKIY